MIGEFELDFLWFTLGHLSVGTSTLITIGLPKFCPRENSKGKGEDLFNIDEVAMEFTRLFVGGMVLLHGISALYFFPEMNRRFTLHTLIGIISAASIILVRGEVYSSKVFSPKVDSKNGLP